MYNIELYIEAKLHENFLGEYTIDQNSLVYASFHASYLEYYFIS